VVGATLLFVAAILPSYLWLTALFAGVTLCLHAFRRPLYARDAAAQSLPTHAYRTRSSEASTAEPRAPSLSFGLAPASAIRQLCTGSLFCCYLGIWTLDWTGGPWPEHSLALDLVFTGIALALAFKARLHGALLGIAATYFHLCVQIGLISAPRTILQWGIASVAVGFVLLIGSLMASLRLRPAKELDSS
jgi:hypothetical protein